MVKCKRFHKRPTVQEVTVMRQFLISLIVVIPFVAQLVVIPWVNHIYPIIFGFPFFHFWLLLWMILTPLFTFAVYRIQKSQGEID
jgi:hypothetical protein